jgi:3-oxoacyl-[acyl-carrier protein] reductase
MSISYDLAGVPTIVTGAGRGIGRAVALRFAASNAQLVLNDCDEAAVQESAQQCIALGATAAVVVGDVTAAHTPTDIVSCCVDQFGAPRIVVNNAGVVKPAPLAELDDPTWNRIVDVNLTAAFRLIRACAEPMIAAAKASTDSAPCNGKIVNITSVDGLFGAVNQTHYSAAKAGIIGLTMALAREWARYRITVNAVAPGAIATKMSESITTDEKLAANILSMIPLRRWGTPDDIAGTVLHLAGADSDYITGQTISVCGGLRIAP